MLAAAHSLLLLNGLGATFGPVIASLVMSRFGPSGLFVHAAVLLAVLTFVAMLRRPQGVEEEKAVPSPLPCMPQITMTLDTRSEDFDTAPR